MYKIWMVNITVHFLKGNDIQMDLIQSKLFKFKEEKYKSFQAKLLPNLDSEIIIGVRMPNLRKLAKEICKKGLREEFIKSLPHEFYEENILHALLINEEKDSKKAFELIDDFVPFLDNWAVVDAINPEVLKKAYDSELLEWIKKHVYSGREFEIRVGILTLKNNFLGERFAPEYLFIPSAVKDESPYYARMMAAWFYAEAVAKQRDHAIEFLMGNHLDKWVLNKSIQKATESFRVSEEDKKLLKKLKVLD